MVSLNAYKFGIIEREFCHIENMGFDQFDRFRWTDRDNEGLRLKLWVTLMSGFPRFRFRIYALKVC